MFKNRLSKVALSTQNQSHFFMQSSKHHYTLKVKVPDTETPYNHVGPNIVHDSIVGKIVTWSLPNKTEIDLELLSTALTRHQQFKHFKDFYENTLLNHPYIQWTIIPYILGADVGLSHLPAALSYDIQHHNEFLHFLVQIGAKYKHYLAGVYGVPTTKHFNFLLETFGVAATVPEDNTHDLITLALTSFDNAAAFDKVRSLLNTGIHINARIDTEYQNTILHYLIALEYNTADVVAFIDFIERDKAKAVHNMRANWELDYTLQDRYGKTPLLLAVGLNAVDVVDTLLKNVVEKYKKNVGLDIPDAQGRTPCMIAAALGHIDCLTQLIRAGANCYLKDKNGRDLLWYAHASATAIKDILTTLSVHPDRCADLDHSYLYSATHEGYPVVLLENQTNEEHLLLLSKEEPFLSMLKIALQKSLTQSDPQLNHHFLKDQIQPVLNQSAESVLHYKLRNQVLTRHLVQETLFRIACALGDFNSVEKMCSGDDFNLLSCDHLNRTAMHYAVMSKKLLQNLIKTMGLSLNAENCLKNHPQIFSYLLQKNNTFLELKNSNGNTPLCLLQRDIHADDQDTREQADAMYNLLKESGYASSMRSFKT